jgi:hypothetical protein
MNRTIGSRTHGIMNRKYEKRQSIKINTMVRFFDVLFQCNFKSVFSSMFEKKSPLEGGLPSIVTNSAQMKNFTVDMASSIHYIYNDKNSDAVYLENTDESINGNINSHQNKVSSTYYIYNDKNGNAVYLENTDESINDNINSHQNKVSSTYYIYNDRNGNLIGTRPDDNCERPDANCSHPEANCEHPDANCGHPEANCSHPEANCSRPDANCEHPDANCEHPDANCEHPNANCAHPDAVGIFLNIVGRVPNAIERILNGVETIFILGNARMIDYAKSKISSHIVLMETKPNIEAIAGTDNFHADQTIIMKTENVIRGEKKGNTDRRNIFGRKILGLLHDFGLIKRIREELNCLFYIVSARNIYGTVISVVLEVVKRDIPINRIFQIAIENIKIVLRRIIKNNIICTQSLHIVQ